MNPGILMVIIMALPQGGTGASFVPVEDRPECERRLGRILPILRQSESRLLEASCFTSAMQFEDFDHDPPADAPRYAFRVTLRGEDAVIERQETSGPCPDGPQTTQNGQPRIYCATSTQNLIQPQP